jgi:hypothetical protein
VRFRPSRPATGSVAQRFPDKVISVPALAAGAVHEVVVTPALDVYLVNAWAIVDPKNFILEFVPRQ